LALLEDIFEAILSTSTDSNDGTSARELHGKARSNARRGACHEHTFALKVLHGTPWFVFRTERTIP
jgi:hypothetical protein